MELEKNVDSSADIAGAFLCARRVSFKFLTASIVAVFLFLIGAAPAQAAITEDAPPIDAFFAPFVTIGGGAVMPLVQFRLAQSTGSDTLSKVGIQLIASSTMSAGEVSRISLWKESGATPGFQLDQDTFISGAASTSPDVTNGSLIVLQPTTAVSIDSSGSQFYVVASTTAITGITNGHAFNTLLLSNYASTTAGGIGTAFGSGKKINLNKSATLKISEVKAGSTGNTSNEFIELYNSGEADINLADLPLRVHSFYDTGSSTPGISLTYYKKVIPSHGYFLITHQSGYSGGAQPDAVFATSTFSGVIFPNGGVSIATGSPANQATSTAIDYVGWGTQGIGNCENAEASSTPCAVALAETGYSLERIATGYPEATSTASSLASGGVDATKGNGFDKNFNRTDFVLQPTPNPQNSLSPVEFPFGGGGSDTSKLQVQGSFPGNGMTNAPKDITFIGFMLNKPVSTTTIISAMATTTVTLKAGGTGPNLCTSVSYNPFPSNFEPPAKCNLSANLSPNTSYTFTATSSIYDLSGNALDQNTFLPGNQPYTATFTTGGDSFTSMNITPPRVVGTSPFNGSQNVPTNIAKLMIEFNQASMDTSTLTNSNITLSGGETLSNLSFSTSSGKNILTADTDGSLTANTKYTITVGTGVKTSVTPGIPLPVAYTASFTTGASVDATAPTIVGVLPANGATITANTSDFIFTFDDNIDSTTATSGAITLGITGGANLPGLVRYDPVAKEGHFTTTNVLPVGQGLTLTLIGASIKNVSGTTLGGPNITKTWTVESVNTDSTAPSILYVNADEFTTAITFNEAVNTTDATTLSNYAVTAGGVVQTLSALAGHTLTYDASTRTAKLSGLRLTSGASLSVVASNIKDISGNQMTSSSAAATVSSATGSGGTGGFVGPGSFSGSTFGDKKDFSSFGIGFMPPVSVKPSSTFISASSTYAYELPLSKQIDAGGTIVITFPSSSDFGLCCVATTSTKNPFLATINADINGPGTGTIGIKTIAKDTTAKTITLTLDTATRSSGGDEHDFLKFSLADMVNPSIPKGSDSSGYALDIKSKNSAGTLLESFSANPVYIGGGTAGGGAVTTIRGTITGNGGNLGGVLVHLMSPQTGPLDATTAADGTYSFANLPVGSQFLTSNFGGGSEYTLFTDPFVNPTATSTGFFGNTMPSPIQATSTSLLTRNFALTATSSAVNFTVNLSAAAATFGATESVDIFAGGPGQFVVQTKTPGAGLLTNSPLTIVPLPKVNGNWGIGIGPAMPKGGMGGFSGPPPAPNWAMPKPISITVSGCPSACATSVGGTATTSNNFTIATAGQTIAGLLKDGSGNAISGASVFAYSAVNGTGSSAQTSATGAFSVKVAAGSYVVSAYSPGVGKSRDVSVVIDSSNNMYVDGSQTAVSTFTLKMTKAGYTITGQVTDGTNAVGNAPVFAYRTDAPGHIDAQTDSSTGNYTLYVDSGTWKVNSFIPGFGPMSEQTVTISGASQSDINFAPTSGTNFSIYSGNLYEDLDDNNKYATTTEAIVGAVIRLSNGTNVNEGVSGADGAFSIRVPSGTGYTIKDIFSPSYGRIAPLNSAGTAIGTLNLTASSTNQYIRVPVRNTITVNIKDSNGNPLSVSKAFIDLFDTSTGLNNHIEISNATTTSLLFASSTSPKIRASIQGVPSANVSVSSDSSQTTVSSGAVTIDNSTETVKVVVSTATAAFTQISGTVYKDAATSGNELDNAWIQFVDATNGVQFGTQATSSGTYLINASNGTYQVLASKPGYVAAPITLTVSGTTTQNFILSSGSLTISGTVTAGGSAASKAFVRAEKVGGGQAITQTDTSGAYSLTVTNGNWKVFATADGYSEGAAAGNPIVVSGSSVTDKNIALTTTASVSSTLATSNTFDATAAGSMSDATVNVKVDLDANTLGGSSASSYLTAKETSNYPHTSSVNLVGSKAKDISAFSNSSQVTNLQAGKTATIELTYTKQNLTDASVTTVAGVSKLTVVAYSDDKKDWETVSSVVTYKDSAGAVIASPSDLSNVATVSFTAVGTHFSDYALSSPTGVTPPDTPTGLTATAGSGVGSAIALAWNTSSGAEGYYIYRDTSSSGAFALLASISSGSTVSYSDSQVSGGTTYYYKVSAYKSSGDSESSASSAVSVASATAGGGGAPGGGGGGASSGPPPRAQRVYPDGTRVYLDEPGATAKIAELDAKFRLAATMETTKITAVVEPQKPAITMPTISAIFSKDLARGARNADVKRLQALLGVEQSGLFGPATEKALKAFQVKQGILKSEKSSGAGKLGPATRAKLREVFEAKATVPNAESVPSAPSVSVSSNVSSSAVPAPVIVRRLSAGSRGSDVKALQVFLGVEATGYFGPATKKAVRQFQEEHGIAKQGDQGFGDVGPLTRSVLKGLGAQKP